MQACWRGAIVSDDAINRTIREIRRAARACGADFGVDTIPRVGYRLTGAGVSGVLREHPAAPAAATAANAPATRRWVLGAALAAAGAGVVPFIARKPGRTVDPAAADLARRGTGLLRTELKEQTLQAVELFDEALRISPHDSGLRGLLALAWAHAAEHDVAGAIEESRRHAATARQMDSGEPNAEVATILVDRGAPDDWFTTEQRLQLVLARDPDHIPARLALGVQWQAAGYSREAKEMNDGTIALDATGDGMRPDTLNRHAFLSWITGSNIEALRAMDRAPLQFPDNPRLWTNHLILRAFTGEYEAARTMVGRARRAGECPPMPHRPGCWRWMRCRPAVRKPSPQPSSPFSGAACPMFRRQCSCQS